MTTQETVLERLNPPDLYKSWSNPGLFHVVSRRDNHTQQRLMILGSYHDTDPNQWYYAAAFECFEDWEEKTRGKPRIIIAEGEQDLWGYASTIHESIERHYSEVGWQCFLADAYGIPMISGEPPDYGEIPHIMKHMVVDDLEDEPLDLSSELPAADLFRELPLLYRMEGDKPDEETYMRQVCGIYQQKLGRLAITHPEVLDLDYSYEHFLALHKKYFGREFGPTTAEMNQLYLKYTSAEMEEESFARLPVARIAPHIMKWRNAHYGALISKYWQQGYSVFSWYGINHTLALGNHLREHGSVAPTPRNTINNYKFQEGIISNRVFGPGAIRTESIDAYLALLKRSNNTFVKR